MRIFLIRAGRIQSHLALDRTLGKIPPTAQYWPFVRQVAAGSYPSGRFEKVSAEQMLERNVPRYFRRNLENLIWMARGQGVQPVLATFAFRPGEASDPHGSETFARALDEQNRLVSEIGAELEVPVFDFARAFPEDPELYAGAVHVNERGARLKARLFADFLLKAQLISPPG